MWCFITNRWLRLANTSHFKHQSELHHFGCPKIRKCLVFKENHQLLWLLPQQILILDVAAFYKLWNERLSHWCKGGTGNTCCIVKYTVVELQLGRQKKRRNQGQMILLHPQKNNIHWHKSTVSCPACASEGCMQQCTLLTIRGCQQVQITVKLCIR